MIKGIFVDFGNTLVRDDADKKLHVLIAKEIKKRYELPEEPKKINDFLSSFVKGGLVNSHIKWPGLLNLYTQAFALLLNVHGKEASLEDIQYFKGLFLDFHAKYSVLYEDAVETLNEFKERGYYIGMISDNDNDILYRILEAKKIKNLFKHIVTSEDVKVGKPNKIIFEKALSLAGLKPEECIYIGNSYFHDVKGAKDTGMLPLHFTQDFKTWKEIRDYVIKMAGKR